MADGGAWSQSSIDCLIEASGQGRQSKSQAEAGGSSTLVETTASRPPPRVTDWQPQEHVWLDLLVRPVMGFLLLHVESAVVAPKRGEQGATG